MLQSRLAFGSLCRDGSTCRCVTPSLVTLHVASHAKGLAAACLRALVRLLAGVGPQVFRKGGQISVTIVADLANIRFLARVNAPVSD